ncbi:MAG: hypothetical protein KAF91_22160, partial [Nostoc sp. TH1S01]|nr:hypothetical protein [Nostoc sp. TH1S01]
MIYIIKIVSQEPTFADLTSIIINDRLYGNQPQDAIAPKLENPEGRMIQSLTINTTSTVRHK